MENKKVIKKKKKLVRRLPSQPIKEEEVNWARASRITSDMTIKKLQRACILRGMPFEEMISSSVLQLHSWFARNMDRGLDSSKLDEFAMWMEGILETQGYPKDHPIHAKEMDLRYTGTAAPTDGIKKPKEATPSKVKEPVKPKVPRTTLEGTNVTKGTKKALTYELAKTGLPIDQVVDKVLLEFEDANESSIRIWYKRALK